MGWARRALLTAAFGSTPAHAAAGYAVHYSAPTSHDPNAGAAITSYAWSFGDGASAAGATAAHVYAKPGVYPVILRITDSFGLVASKTASLAVSAPGKIVSLTTKRQGSGEFLVVTVNQGGTIRAGTGSATLAGAGSHSFRVGVAPAQHHNLSVNVTVVYTPRAGPGRAGRPSDSSPRSSGATSSRLIGAAERPQRSEAIVDRRAREQYGCYGDHSAHERPCLRALVSTMVVLPPSQRPAAPQSTS